jgi:hypothetical protein
MELKGNVQQEDHKQDGNSRSGNKVIQMEGKTREETEVVEEECEKKEEEEKKESEERSRKKRVGRHGWIETLRAVYFVTLSGSQAIQHKMAGGW